MQSQRLSYVASNEFWKEFIHVYRQRPILWDSKHEYYRNRPLKMEAYKALTAKLKEIDANATYRDVRRKIESLRGSIRRERRRANECKQKDRPFVTQLWFYNEFAFLRENGGVVDISSDEDDIDEVSSAVISNFHDDDPNVNIPTNSKKSKNELPNSSIKRLDKQSQPDKPPDKVPRSDAYPQSDNPTMAGAKQDDESEIFGKSWVLKYRRLSEPQKIFAMRAIDEIFYKGLLGQLCERTTIMEMPLQRNEPYSDPNTEQYAMPNTQQEYEPPYFEPVSIKMDEEHPPTSDF